MLKIYFIFSQSKKRLKLVGKKGKKKNRGQPDKQEKKKTVCDVGDCDGGGS